MLRISAQAAEGQRTQHCKRHAAPHAAGLQTTKEEVEWCIAMSSGCGSHVPLLQDPRTLHHDVDVWLLSAAASNMISGTVALLQCRMHSSLTAPCTCKLECCN